MKSQLILKSAVLTIVLIVITVGAAATLYNLNSMKPAVAKEINDPRLPVRILIATQGSEFKDSVVAHVIDKLKDRSMYIKVIDVRDLKAIDPPEWTAIVIIHSWEAGRPPKAVSDFVKRASIYNLIVLTTSGDGTHHMNGVDGITSASKSTDVDRCTREILNRIEIIIAPEEISIEAKSTKSL